MLDGAIIVKLGIELTFLQRCVLCAHLPFS